MEGFEVVTSDDCKFGHVVSVEESHLIIEHGMLKKSRHAVPETFAHTDDAEQTVRLTVPKQIVESSPKLDGDTIDSQAVAEHYGLAEGAPAPETDDAGDVLQDNPSTADQDAFRAGPGTTDDDPAAEGTTAGYLNDRSRR
jgi:hypothetical protein